MYTVQEYHGANLHLLSEIAEIFPTDLPLDRWPSYCGAGRKGDRLVPEYVCGVCVSCVCYLHDIDWAVADGWRESLQANTRLYTNLKNLVLANYDESHYTKLDVEFLCLTYYIGTNIGTFLCFDKSEPDTENIFPFNYSQVREKTDRLFRYMDEEDSKCLKS